MAALVNASLSFLREWIRTVIRASTRAVKIAKTIAFVGAFLWVLSPTNKIKIAVTSEQGKNLMTSEMEIGSLVVIAVMLIVLVIAFGMTLVCFRRIEVSPIVERDVVYYRLAITNFGWAEADVRVRLERIADERGMFDNNRVPVELGWMHHGKDRPKLAYGLSEKVALFAVSNYAEKDDIITSVSISAYSLAGEEVKIGTLSVNQKNKLWLNISITGQSDRWYSIQMISDTSHALSVALENPPHLC